MLQAKIIYNGCLLNTIEGDCLDPLLYEVASWTDQVCDLGKNDKLIIEVTNIK
ncbi:MAG: hypothetical protein NC222_06945 [Staphylococcus sp.]|nr:hypothetical protein [Staphylococcus sp.]